MRALPCFAFSVLIGCLPAVVQAGQAFDAGNQARSIAPFVDAETAAVAHVDFSRVSIDSLVDFMTRLVPDATQPGAKEALSKTGREAANWLEAFRRAGGKDVYFLISLSTPGPLSRVFAVIPLGAKADEEAILAAIGMSGGARRRVGDALVVGLTPWSQIPAQFRAAPRPELVQALAAAGDTAVQAVLIPPASSRRVVEELMPQLPPQVGGGPSTVLTRGIRWAAIGLDLPPQLNVRLVIESADAKAAEALRLTWSALVKWAGEQNEVRRFVPQFEPLIALLTPRTEGDRLLLSLDGGSRAFVDLLASVNKSLERARGAARRTRSMSNMKQILLVLHNYNARYKHFPAPASSSPDGKPLLSWRVHILPYLGQQTLYDQFHLDEPWDSSHNKSLIPKMPAVLLSPFAKTAAGLTTYLVPVGDGALYASPKDQPRFNDVRDGLSNTIMLVEVDDAHAVVWTRPDDLAFDPKDPKRGIGNIAGDGFPAGMGDGSVRLLPKTIDPKTLRASITRAGGENPNGL